MFSQEYLQASAYLFEQSHGNDLGEFEASMIKHSGLSSAVPEEVADCIWRSLDEPAPSNYRTSAYWALGKLARKSDLKRFIQALEIEVKLDIQVAYQILIALDNLAEPVFSRSGVSVDEDDLNRRDALAYLASKK